MKIPLHVLLPDNSRNIIKKIDENVTDNISKLFRGGYLTIEHLGIRYTYTITEMLNILVWADTNEPGGSSVWADEAGTGGVFAV